MSLENIRTPIDSPTGAREAVKTLKVEFKRKKGLTPLELRDKKNNIIEAMDRAAMSAKDRRVQKIYMSGKRDLEVEYEE